MAEFSISNKYKYLRYRFSCLGWSYKDEMCPLSIYKRDKVVTTSKQTKVKLNSVVKLTPIK